MTCSIFNIFYKKRICWIRREIPALYYWRKYNCFRNLSFLHCFLHNCKKQLKIILIDHSHLVSHCICHFFVPNISDHAKDYLKAFKQQLKHGGPITVTDQAIERYFMTIQEASLLVALSGAIGENTQTFVLEMGKPVKIVQLAEQLITLSGKWPYIDIPIEFTGLRPGEKMYEELFYTKENLKQSGYDKLMSAHSTTLPYTEIEHILEEIKQYPTKEKLLEIVGKYNEYSS